MKNQKIILLTIFLICGMILSACGKQVSSAEQVEPIQLEKLDDSRNKLILTSRAAERLDVQTAAVSETMMNEQTYLTVPYSTIIYDLEGGTWIYVNPEPLTYHREKVEVEMIDGNMVLLKAGPPAGTMVVTTAVAELYGADTGVGK